MSLAASKLVSSSSPCVLAMDGGGSKTLMTVVRRDASIAFSCLGSGSNPFDRPDWRGVIKELVLAWTGELSAACLGMAGYGESETLTDAQIGLAAELLVCPHSVANDVDVACAGAFADGPGILLLSGTGSMVWANDGRGHNARVGGWGALFGDEGSAFWIGREMLSVLTQQLDGRMTPDDAMIMTFAQMLNLPPDKHKMPGAILEWYGGMTHERSAVAAVARYVSSLADAGSSDARKILEEAAAHLVRHIAAARAKFAPMSLPWSYAGGTFSSALLLDSVTAACGKPVHPILPPIGGALLRAAKMAGWCPDDQWIKALGRSLDAS